MPGAEGWTYCGDSFEQREAEKILIAGPSERLGVTLSKKRFELPGGNCLEIDGVSELLTILAEAQLVGELIGVIYLPWDSRLPSHFRPRAVSIVPRRAYG